MKFKVLLETLLMELSGDEIYQKYYSNIPYDTFIEIIGADPQTIIEDGKIKRVGKYGKLLLSLYQKGGLQLEDIPKANEYLGYVYKHNVAIDSKKINGLGDLYNLISQFIVKTKLDLSSILEALKPGEDYKMLHNGKEWFIFQPLTEKGSSYLGYNTEWCTAWGQHSTKKEYRERSCRFDSHNNQGPLFIIINKNDTDVKYQLHIESKQYMDKNDRRITVSDLFDANPEIKYYFFPSFVREVSKEEIQNELNRIDFLSHKDGMVLIMKSVDVVENRLVQALLNEDMDLLNELISYDDKEPDDISIYKGKLIISANQLGGDCEDASRAYDFYAYEANNGSEYVRDDIYNMDGENLEEMLSEYLQSFYENKTEELNNGLSVKSFDEFKNIYFTMYRNDDNIIDWFEDKILDITVGDYEQANADYLNHISESIDFDDRQMEINLVKFIKFLTVRNITKISDEGGDDKSVMPLWDLMDKYLYENDIPTDYETQYVSLNQPTFKGDSYGIDKFTVQFFENIIENPESEHKCLEIRKTFYEIVKKYFNSGNFYEDDNKRIFLKSMNVNCENETVLLKYLNKETNETHEGNVKIENIVPLINNYKLFENRNLIHPRFL